MKAKIISTVIIVFISIVILVALTLFTAHKPPKMIKGEIKLTNLPKTVKLVGYDKQQFNTDSIIKKNTIIFVGNAQSILIANDLERMLKLPAGKFIIVSNISDEPWFLKKFNEYEKNEKLKGSKHIPWIYDENGSVRNYLKVPTSDPLKFFVYKVNTNGIINRIYIGKVEKSVTNGKISINLKQVVSDIQNHK